VPARPKVPDSPPACAEVVHGDAFELLRRVGTETVNLVVTSPPYWGLRSYGHPHDEGILERWKVAGCEAERVPPYDWYKASGGQLGLEPYPHWYVTHLVEFFQRVSRVLKPDGSVWVNLGDTYFARWASVRDGGRQGYVDTRTRRRTPSGGYLKDKQLLLMPARFAIAMQDSGWILRNDLIWAKPNVMPRPERDRLRLSHEHWFHFVKPNPKGRAKYYYDLEQCEEDALDVVTCATVPGPEGHSATFPSAIVAPRIASSCPEGGLVLDPFCGTGRALVEALTGGRCGLGFELSEQYVDTALAQLRTVDHRPPSSHGHLSAEGGDPDR
jgi:site-specific DNA-methyltransferase (cytosine-N4-specific)